jgi:hypothetical protein
MYMYLKVTIGLDAPHAMASRRPISADLTFPELYPLVSCISDWQILVFCGVVQAKSIVALPIGISRMTIRGSIRRSGCSSSAPDRESILVERTEQP